MSRSDATAWWKDWVSSMFVPSGETLEQMMRPAGGYALPPMSFAGPAKLHSPGLPQAMKRLLDISLAAVLLLVSAVPLLIVALLIRRESSGPALFRQRRVGLDGTNFTIWKLRTMHAQSARGDTLCQAQRGDPRVTRIGAWLRCRSFDELPQLVNVLRGDMSLVGPRPHAPGTCAGGRPFEQISPLYMARHHVRPGMTGLAQVRGWRGETETEDKLLRRVDSDLEYIATWSLWLDLVILARTLAMVNTRNAY
jgi:lipopolysaccharide/colanic/teichoic acid biosynthesis glycosyltransferase